MASSQIAVRLSEDLLTVLDQLVDQGVFENRAAVVRAGIEAIAERERQRAVDRAVVEGYQRIPPGEVDIAAALASLREAVADEPW